MVLFTVTQDDRVCARIVRWARRGDLPALCLACRALQHHAEARLYEVVVANSAHAALRVCQTILAQPRLGQCVRSFCFLPDTRRVVPDPVWSALQRALSRMRALEYLFLQDPSLGGGWVLGDTAHIPFQLLEARLLFQWDTHLVKFLESQNKLKSLHAADGPGSDPALLLEAGSLPELRMFDGPLSAAEHILAVGSSLSHLQVVLESNSEADLLRFVPKLSQLSPWLRALSILHLPEGVSIDALRSITKACPQLRHLGTIPLPLPRHSYRFHGSLMAMRELRVLQLDLTSWVPAAMGTTQRAIAAEIRIYVPLIEHVCFWSGAGRSLWSVDGNDWGSRSDVGQHSQLDALWKAS